MTPSTEPPAPPPQKLPQQTSRRRLLIGLGSILTVLAAAAVSVPILGYLFRPWFRWKRDQWVDVGALDDFAENETRPVTAPNPVVEPWSGKGKKVAMYVRRKMGQEFVVFAVNCAHLECPVSWFPDSGLFMCPCHGGVYDAEGQRVAGPPPRGLYHYPHRIKNGRLMVRVGHLPTLAEPA